MRKYDLLKIIYESLDGITPKEIAFKLKISLPNIYSYLKELKLEGLIQEDGGRYKADRTNENVEQLLEIKAMSPEIFDKLITPKFKKILSIFCRKLVAEQTLFTQSEVEKIEKIAKLKRIVLRLSLRPVKYCLKINEGLVKSLLAYHDLKPEFSLTDFNKLIESTRVKESKMIVENAESDLRVVKQCEEIYRSNQDILILSKAKEFSPDSRIKELLKKSEQINKEYLLFFNGLDNNTKQAMINEWNKKYIYNTNSIEGNTMSEKDVENYFEEGEEPEKISKREIYETNNLLHAILFLDIKREERLSESLIKEIHFMVQKDISCDFGQYKQIYNYIRPSSFTTPPKQVGERMKLLINWYKQNEHTLHPFILASIFHMQFEMIHPFADGNGRVGRLLMNHILQQKGYRPITILEKSKQNYYVALENRSILQFLLHILTAFIEEYKR